jgi:hypothetical protein
MMPAGSPATWARSAGQPCRWRPHPVGSHTQG